jgi:anthranilate/para-aminobenzoate synthase component I
LISPERIALNVSIRTIAMAREGADGGVLRYGAGCGIVAESEPRNEYEESLHKSAVLLRTAHMLGNLGNTAGSGAGAGTGISATGAARAS